jgi:hypothetical protein
MEMYSLRQIELATALAWLFGVVLVVSVIAFLSKRRSVFVGGAIGSLLGFVIPQPRTESICSSAEGAFLVAVNDYVYHVVAWGVFGAIIGTGLGLVVAKSGFLKKRELPTTDERQSAAKPDQLF